MTDIEFIWHLLQKNVSRDYIKFHFCCETYLGNSAIQQPTLALQT